MPQEVFIEWFSSAFGEVQRTVPNLANNRGSAALVAQFLNDDFEFYRKTASNVFDLALRAAAGIRSSRVERLGDVDALIFGCEDFDDFHRSTYDSLNVDLRNSAADWANELGLATVPFFGLWLAGCGNLASGIAQAYALISSGHHTRILLCMVNCYRAGVSRGGSLSAASVISDAATACIVTSKPTGGVGFRFESAHLSSNLSLMKIDRTKNKIQYFMKYRSGLKHAAESFLKKSRLAIQDYDYVLAPNVGSLLIAAWSDVLGIDAKHFIRIGKSQHAHAGASDHLYALAKLGGDESKHLMSGKSVLLLNPGICCWNFIGLTGACSP